MFRLVQFGELDQEEIAPQAKQNFIIIEDRNGDLVGKKIKTKKPQTNENKSSQIFILRIFQVQIPLSVIVG